MSRVTSYSNENELLKEQLALTAMEIKQLHAELEVCTCKPFFIFHNLI